jgi:hypothetical protein
VGLGRYIFKRISCCSRADTAGQQNRRGGYVNKSLVVLLSLLALSCKDDGVSPTDHIPGRMLFEIEYTNWAWGFTYRGTVVFDDGTLYSYNPGMDTATVLCHPDERYTEAELASKYSHHRLFVRTVSRDTLLLMRQLASEVTVSDYSDTTGVGADMGSLLYSVYEYRSDAERFQKKILRLDGDWTFYNRSDAAVSLTSLMRNL